MECVLPPGGEMTICPGDLRECIRIVSGAGTGRTKAHDVVAGLVADLPEGQQLALQPVTTGGARLLVRVPLKSAPAEKAAIGPAFAELVAQPITRFAKEFEPNLPPEELPDRIKPLPMPDGAIAIVWDASSRFDVLAAIDEAFKGIRVFVLSRPGHD